MLFFYQATCPIQDYSYSAATPLIFGGIVHIKDMTELGKVNEISAGFWNSVK